MVALKVCAGNMGDKQWLGCDGFRDEKSSGSLGRLLCQHIGRAAVFNVAQLQGMRWNLHPKNRWSLQQVLRAHGASAGVAVVTMLPKPKDARKAVEPIRVLRDGREIIRTSTNAGKRLYYQRKVAMLARQGWVCGLQISPWCPKNLTSSASTFEHVNGRGHGGGKRDDRILVDGKPQNLAVCLHCNALKGSRSLEAVTKGTHAPSIGSN